MTFTVDASEMDRFGTRLQGAERIVGTALTRGVDRLTIAAEGFAKEGVGVRTGHLRRSIAHQPAVFAGGVATGSVGTNVPYARIHEEGRGPVVARGKALRFQVGGKTIYRKRVGPAAGRWYMKKARARVAPMARAEAARMGAEIMAEVMSA
jgi:hypothetical protein